MVPIKTFVYYFSSQACSLVYILKFDVILQQSSRKRESLSTTR
jgi:hypothetical protein